MEKRHINRNRRLAAAVATMALAGLSYNANAALNLELTLDPNSPGAGKSQVLSSLTPITLDVWASVTGANANPEALQSVQLNFRSTGNILGNITNSGTSPNAPFNGLSSQTGASFGTAGDLDLGSTNNSDLTGWWVARSGTPVTNGSGQFLLGKLTFTPTSLGDGSATSLQVTLRNSASAALWFEDGTTTAGTSPGGAVWSGDKTTTTGTVTYGAAIVLTGVVGPTDSEWTRDSAGGNWTTSSNWAAGVPNGVDATARFLATGSASGHRTVDLDANQTVGNLVFAGTNGYTISTASARVLSLDSATSVPSITINGGASDISASVSLLKNVTVGGTAGSLTLSSLNNSGGKTITKSGASTLTLSGTQTHGTGAALSVSAGVVNLNSNTGTEVDLGPDTFPDSFDETPATANLSVNVTTGGTVNINANNNLKALTIATDRSPSNGGTGAGDTRIQIGNGVRVHVYDNGTNDALNPSRGTAEALWAGAQAGYYDDVNWNGGDGSGTIGGGEFGNGIFLTGVANTTVNGLGMAMIDDGNSFENALEMREMALGDTNGDNSVDGSDAGTFASFFGNAPGGFGYSFYTWMEGDFNGDLAVDGADAGIFASAFGSTFSPANSPSAGVSAVPEPASLGILAIGAVGLMRRRRKA